MKTRLRSGNACYHSVQYLLSASWLFKNLKIMIYRTIILFVVLYGRETWSLTLREIRKLRVFDNRVLRRIFGLNRDEVRREWGKIHNEKCNDLHSSSNIFSGVTVENSEVGGACSGYGGEERRIQGFGWETCGKETT